MDHQLRDSIISTTTVRAEETASRIINDALDEFGRLVARLSSEGFSGRAVIGVRVEGGNVVSAEVDSEEIDGTVTGPPIHDRASRLDRFRDAISLSKRAKLYGYLRSSFYYHAGVIVGGGLMIRRTFR